MVVSGALALVKIFAGLAGHSTAVVADGLESASDVLASGFVLLGLTLAAIPPDENHPYGHGRVETLTGLLIGLILSTGGALIAYGSIQRVGRPGPPVASFVVWPLAASLVAKCGLAVFKFRWGRKLGSDSLVADAWNDAMDTLSALAALTAVALTLSDPVRFRDADR
jgi:cation diffusion facilitator family transporter